MHFFIHVQHQKLWSEQTFGPGQRTEGVVNHIRKELDEVLEAPDDVSEWIDIIILAMDGAWRAGHSPREIADALEAKQQKNIDRAWPDWRNFREDEPIEHLD